MRAIRVEIQEFTEFLMDYTISLLAVGSYTSRVERCVRRIGAAFGYDVHISIFSKNITISVVSPEDYSIQRTYVRGYKDGAINFRAIYRLSGLSWYAYDEKITFANLKKNYDQIITKQQNSFYSALFLSSFAFGAFCKLFGGDFGAIGIVFFSTLIGFSTRYLLTRINIDSRVIFAISAFVASIIAFLLGSFTKTPDVAIGTSVLFLIPGIHLINSVIDILDGHVLVGFARMMRVGIAISCIAIGLYATLSFAGIKMEY